jgi:hypothetical protein
MAIEQTVIVDKLKEEGISETLGNGLVFETDADLGVWVESYKSGLPAPEKKLQDYTKDEITELAKDPQFKGAKGLQGYIDSLRQKPADPKPADPKPKPTDEPPEWAKLLIEDNKNLKSANAAKDFDNLLKTVGKAEELSEIHISRVKKGLKSDATEAEIKAEIVSYKKELTELGIKEFGTPGQSGGKGNSSISSAAKAWKEKQLKKNK